MSEELTRVLTDLIGAKFDGLTKQIEQLDAQYFSLGEQVDGKAAATGVEQLSLDLRRVSSELSLKAEAAVVDEFRRQFQQSADSLQQKVADLEAQLRELDRAVDAKLEVLSDTAKMIESLNNTIIETVVGSRRSAELDRLRVQLQTLGDADKVPSGASRARRRGWWLRLCACERRQQPASGTSLGHEMVSLAESKSTGKATSSSLPPSSGDPLPEDDLKTEMQPQDILTAVLQIEKSCLNPEAEAADGVEVDRLVDDPTMVYCTCSSPESPTVLSCLWALYEDVSADNLKRALLSEEERTTWDPDCEFRVCQRREEGDPLCSDVVHHVLHAPWPFWDRDVLQRRWQLPLGNDGQEGSAIVMRSVSDDLVLPEQPGRVRAFVSKAAFLLRPATGGRGIQITVCSQLDVGGLIPQWAQNFLMRFAVQRAEAWKDKLHEHCVNMASRSE